MSHMTFHQLFGHAFAFGSKIDTLWQRIVYIHIGMVAAVIFLAGSNEPYLAARSIVLGFYSFNVFITYWNLRDAYRGLECTVADLKRFPETANPGELETWLRQRSYSGNSLVRALILLAFWALIAYLLLVPVFGLQGLDAVGDLNQSIMNATPQKN